MVESQADSVNLFKKKSDRAKESPPEQEDMRKGPARAPLDYIPAEWYYDMAGDKFMLIFNHYEYMKTVHFEDEQPETRTGTSCDVRALTNTFSRLGFQVEPHTHHDKTHMEILNILRKFCDQDHRNTSCVCVCVLTHGERGGELFAADMPYEMKDLLKILQYAAPGLVGKPKMLIVQACRGGLVDPGREVQLDGPDDGVLLPSHVDTLVLTSSVEDYVSWREADGSWLIQELCRVVDATHGVLDVQQMVALVTSLVARERQSNTPSDLSTHKMKQTPEMRSTLTKLLRLTPAPLI